MKIVTRATHTLPLLVNGYTTRAAAQEGILVVISLLVVGTVLSCPVKKAKRAGRGLFSNYSNSCIIHPQTVLKHTHPGVFGEIAKSYFQIVPISTFGWDNFLR
jgi:hypothetical protein